MLTRKAIRALLTALLAKMNDDITIDPKFLSNYPLSGGYSGAYVAITWVDPLPTLIVKAGPADKILQETEARRRFNSPGLEAIRNLGLDGCSEPVEIEVDGRDEMWRAMAYMYIGSLSYEDLASFSDFQAIFEDFVAPSLQDRRPSTPALRDWLRRLCNQIERRDLTENAKATIKGIRAKPLSEFLPSLPWADGLVAVLDSASVFAPEESALHGLREWWDAAVSRESIAPFPNRTLLHGDMHFANVLVNRTTATVELIDFGNSSEGHVFRDLARFECDLLFRVPPPLINTETLRLSSQDRQIRTLECAFRAQAGTPHDPIDSENSQLSALKILREVYDAKWHLSSDEGRHRMYLWFLFAEVLKRLMWIGESNGTLTARRALLCSVAMLKKALSDEDVQVAGFSSVSGISRLLGCTALYVPSHGYEATVNRERNATKIIALRTAKANRATVRLLAETGNSFLHFRGAFYPEIEALLEFGKLEIVLANPYFVESHGISAAYKDRANVDDAGLHSLLKQKFEESFSGYRSLRSQAGPRIQTRIARYAISSTLLMTDEDIFFEPYFRSDRSRRHRRLFETFELRFSARNEHVRKLSNEHFEFHWRNSDPLEADIEFRDRYIAILAEVTEIWQGA